MTGIIRPGIGSRAFFLQPRDPGFQVAYPLAKTVQFGRYPLVRPADMAEECLRHYGSSSLLSKQIPCHRV